MKKQLKQWEKSTKELAEYFIKKYFGKDIFDVWWVADEVGGCLCANDYFFDLTEIVDFIKYNYTEKQMFDYYDYQQKYYSEQENIEINPICIRDWKKLTPPK